MRRNVPRTPNPNGDPIAVRKKGDIHKVRYYRTVAITHPTERKVLRRGQRRRFVERPQ